MSNFIFLILGFSLGWWLSLRHCPKPKKKQISRSARAKTNKINTRKRQSKTEKKKKILIFLKKYGHAKNDDIEKLLGISDATVTRYMNELEKEGRVIQKGKPRGGAYYILK